MCDCLKKSEERVKDHLVEQRGLVNVEEFGYDNTALTFGDNDSDIKIYLPFSVSHKPIKKDGSIGNLKTHKVSIFPTFCPFCGVKLVK